MSCLIVGRIHCHLRPLSPLCPRCCHFCGVKMTDESWRHGSVSQRHLHLLNSEFMADCTFVVGIRKKKKFQCHKFVLSQSSSVFYAMFNGDLKEKGDVKVEDIEPQHFRKMLEFIYSDSTELENVEKALGVCYAAKKYMIDTLTLKCIDFIKVNLDENVVIKALEFARLIDNADLEAESLLYLQTNTSGVLKSASFPDAEMATLLTILGQDHLCVTSEVEVFSACIRWAKAAKAQQRGAKVSLRDVLGHDALSLFRFLTLTADEFATVVIPSKLLQLQEERDLLCRLVTGTGNVPRGFNNNTENRSAFYGPIETIEIPNYVSRYGYQQNYGCHGQELNDHIFNFNVNEKCFIYGLQLHGLCSGTSVQDSFEINLLLSSKLLGVAKFEGLMSPGNKVKVNFKIPVFLKANTDYDLQTRYSNLNISYAATNIGSGEYFTDSGELKMNVNYTSTSISQIYIAKKMH